MKLNYQNCSFQRPLPNLDCKLLAQNIRQFTRAKSLRTNEELDCSFGKSKEKDINITTKSHVIFEQVLQSIEKSRQALGILSEQAFESVHYDFLETWKLYKVSPDHKDYAQRLLDAVLNYKYYHIAGD